MKLYFNPYACSLAPLIAATEAGISLDLAFVDIMKDPHTLADGSNYLAVNEKNYVPLLELESGERITEVSVILQVLAESKPEADLAPANGTWARVKLQETLNFLASELHKFYSPWLFHPEVGERAQAYAREKIAGRYALIEKLLADRDYLLGEFSVADAYLFVMVNWAHAARTPLADFPNIRGWFRRMKERPAVIDAVALHTASPAKVAA